MRFLIATPKYNPRSGGSVALFRLGHELCALGHEAALWWWNSKSAYPSNLTPKYNPRASGREELLRLGHKLCVRGFEAALRPFKPRGKDISRDEFSVCFLIPDEFSVPYAQARDLQNLNNVVVVYPEVVSGNPLRARHRVRWLLNEPGYIVPKIQVDRRDYFVRYGDWVDGFRFHGMQLRKRPLTITHIPEAYLRGAPSDARDGMVYCIRKGKRHFDPALVQGGECIDAMGHDEIAERFRHVRRFISFDNRTFLTRLAVLCGAEVVVVPDPEFPVPDLSSNNTERYGVAFGFSEEELAFAQKTSPLMRKAVIEKLARQPEEVAAFVQDCGRCFGLAF